MNETYSDLRVRLQPKHRQLSGFFIARLDSNDVLRGDAEAEFLRRGRDACDRFEARFEVRDGP